MKIGVISDNHGYMHPKVYDAFVGVERILHAGDIGSLDIITSLEALAPVAAVHGNIDTFPLVTRYPEVLAIDINGVRICIIHEFRGLADSKIQHVATDMRDGKFDIIIYGHSHKAKIDWVDGVLTFNPGAAGKRRFSLQPAVGILQINDDATFSPQILYLDEI